MKIKAALLDFDGTIINSLPAVNGYFFSALERKGITFSKQEQDALFAILHGKELTPAQKPR